MANTFDDGDGSVVAGFEIEAGSDATFGALDAAVAVNAADVFDMNTVLTAFQSGIHSWGQISLLDATQNPDGSYTVSNGGEVWAGPLSGPDEVGNDNVPPNNIFRFFNPQTGVFQMQFGTVLPNGVAPTNGVSDIQGKIVGWNGDSLLVQLYGSIDLQTGQLSDPLTSSAGQAAYVLFSSEDMNNTNGVPTSGDVFGQPTDSATLGALSANLGVSPPILPSSVDASAMLDIVANNLSAGYAAWVKVSATGDGNYSATMDGVTQNAEGGYEPLNSEAYNGDGLEIRAIYQGNIIELGADFGVGGNFYDDVGYGQIIGWNGDGVLLEMYGTYQNGVLSNLAGGFQQFVFLSQNDMTGTTIPTDAPEVFGQDPNNFPSEFGLVPPAPPPPPGPAPLFDPVSLTALNDFAFPGYQEVFSTGHVVLADATENANGSYTLSLAGGEPWAGSVGTGYGDNAKLSIAVNYSDPTTGAMDFSFAAVGSGATLPTVLDGEFYGKVVAWDGTDVLIQLYQHLDESTGVLSDPVDPSQGPAYMLLSAKDFATGGGTNGASGVLDGVTLGQPADAGTIASLGSSMGVGLYLPPSAVDLTGMAADLEGKSSDFGAFVNVTNQGNGAFSATDTYKPYVWPGSSGFPPYANGTYADFTESADGTDSAPGYTIHIDNVYAGGVFEWELDNSAPESTWHNQNPTGVVDHFFSKVIGYNADGILVQNYTSYSNGQLSGAVSGVEEYAYFSTNDLQTTDLQDTPAQFGQDPSQLPNGLGVTPAAPPPPPAVNIADVFDMASVESALANIYHKGQISLLDATQNADGSYTVSNGGEVWAGPLSGPNETGGDGLAGNFVRFFNAQTGVIQIQLGGTTPNGVAGVNGIYDIQGQIVGWNGDSFLIKLYGNLDNQTGQLSDPLTSTADQAAYVVMSAEDMFNTDGIPTSGATFGQPTDSATLAGLQSSLGVYPPIPAAPVDASGAVDALGENLSTGYAGWVAVTANSDGTYNATMDGSQSSSEAGYQSLNAFYQGWGLDIVSVHAGGILEVGLTFSPGGNFYGDLGYGQIIGWNGNGILLRMYSTYSDDTLSDLKGGNQQFLYISESDLTGTTIPADAPQVFGQDPSDFPPDFGLAPPPPPPAAPLPFDPATITGVNNSTFDFFHGGGGFATGHIVLADATQNGNGSYTLSLNEPWAGSIESTSEYYGGGNVGLSIAVDYSNIATGAVEFSFAATSGGTLPTVLDGEFYGKIVAWDGSDLLIQLYQHLDPTTGLLSDPVDPSQGPAYMVISSFDYADPNVDSAYGSGVLDGKTMGQPTDADTYAALQSGLGVSEDATPSAVSLPGLQVALNGQSTDFGAFVNVTNLGNGAYSATDQFKPYVWPGSPNYAAYAAGTYADFSESSAGTDGIAGYTIHIDNVYSVNGTGIFEWELDNPDPAPSRENPDPTGVLDHYFALVIGYNADGVLVQNYLGYSNGHVTGLVGGVQEYAYFSANDLQDTDLGTTPAQFGQDTSQLTNAVGAALPCFAAGTRLRTARGDVAVERLRVGDHMQTASGALRPVKWVGYRHVDCTRHPDPEKVWPVRVAAGAFGPGLPVHDLYLSPDHALFVEGVLIPVKLLINHTTIEQVPEDAVTYHHVELDSHDVLLAEGLPAESFLDTGNRDSFANGGGAVRLHPDFTPDWHALVWEAQACARLVLCGPELAAARAQLRCHATKMAPAAQAAA